MRLLAGGSSLAGETIAYKARPHLVVDRLGLLQLRSQQLVFLAELVRLFGIMAIRLTDATPAGALTVPIGDENAPSRSSDTSWLSHCGSMKLSTPSCARGVLAVSAMRVR